MVALLAGQALGALGNHLTGAQPGLQGRNPVSLAGYTTSDQNSEIARAQMGLIWESCSAVTVLKVLTTLFLNSCSGSIVQSGSEATERAPGWKPPLEHGPPAPPFLAAP